MALRNYSLTHPVPETDKTPENKEDKSDVANKECAAVQTFLLSYIWVATDTYDNRNVLNRLSVGRSKAINGSDLEICRPNSHLVQFP